MPVGPVWSWSKEDKIIETIKRSEPYLGPVLWQQVKALLSPTNIAIMLGTLVLWAASHLVGVGEIVDVALLLVGAVMLGPAIVDVAENLLKFGKCIDARSEQDLQGAAQAFANAAIKGGITVIMAILLRRGAKAAELEAAEATGIARPSWLQVAKPKGRIGLPEVGPDPQPDAMWSKLPAKGSNKMPAGTGETDAWGQIWYSLRGTLTEQRLAFLHETVHRLFTPKFRLFRTFRVRLNMAGYSRSVILKYLEEALAESYAQVKVTGFRGLVEGIRFPVQNGYLSIGELAAEGQAIGTIIVGGQQFVVNFVLGPPKWAAEIPPPSPSRPETIRILETIRLPEEAVTGGFAVTVTPGSSLSAIAKAQYGDFNLWPLIYDLNKVKIGPNPNRIKPGTKLLLMQLSAFTPAEVAAAKRRAPSWKHAPL